MYSLTKKNTLPITLWMTGLPCSGKTTLARKLKEKLEDLGYRVVHLDADGIRKGINSDLGFSNEDRKENLRRVAHIAKILNENGNLVIASFVSPFNKLRDMVKTIVDDFRLIYVKCSLDICEKRDVKHMYKKARKGEIKEFTGVSAIFEEPGEADVVVDTEHIDVENCIYIILGKLGFDS